IRDDLVTGVQTCALPILRPLAAALVRPPAAKLADPDGGPEYLRIQADLLSRPRPVLGDRWHSDPTNSMFRWRALVDPFLDEESEIGRASCRERVESASSE